MAIHLRAANLIQQYMVNRDTEALEQLISLLQDEVADPSIQAAVLTLKMSQEDVERAIMEEDYLKLPVVSVDADVPVHEDKLIRIMCKNQQEGSCMILKVGHLDDNYIKLFPIGGFE